MSIVNTQDFSWLVKMGLISSRMCQTIDDPEDARDLPATAKRDLLDFFQPAILVGYAQLQGAFIFVGMHAQSLSFYLVIYEVLKEKEFISDDTPPLEFIKLLERVQNLLHFVVRGEKLELSDQKFLLQVMSSFSDYFTCKSEERGRQDDD